MAHSATGRRITAATLQFSSIDRTIARANPLAPEDQTGRDPHVLREMRTMSRCGHHLHKHTAISRSTQIRCSTRKRRRGRQGLNRLRTLLGAVLRLAQVGRTPPGGEANMGSRREGVPAGVGASGWPKACLQPSVGPQLQRREASTWRAPRAGTSPKSGRT